jgi:hypothetical protein
MSTSMSALSDMIIPTLSDRRLDVGHGWLPNTPTYRVTDNLHCIWNLQHLVLSMMLVACL